MRGSILISLAIFIFMANDTYSQVPALPDGAATHWIVDDPEEIVVYLLFDPATVSDRLPSNLRFITVGELAAKGVSWAVDHLAEERLHSSWGISFIEIVKMGRFVIDGHSPQWPPDGAIALWAARVAPLESSASLEPGRPLLVLEFWLPDSQYVAYMNKKGHYADHGDVALRQDTDGQWLGSIRVEGLRVTANCTVTGQATGGAGSRGMQLFIPPDTAGSTSLVRLAFAGHRIRNCKEGSSWEIEGTHALAQGVTVGDSTFQDGYDLVGGAFPQ